MSLFLTIDLGTTYFKVCIFDEAGRIVTSRRIAPPVERSTRGTRHELPAEAFRQTLIDMVQDIGADPGVDLSQVISMSFATQANSFLLLDKEDRALTPIILWTDERACPLNPDVEQLSLSAGFYRDTGVPEMNGLFMPAKLHWLKQHAPEAWSRTRRLCLISDYLTYWMTGRHVTEAGTAGLSGMVNIHTLQWRPEAYQILEVPVDCLPAVVRAGTDLGCLKPDMASVLGLSEGCRFIVGCLDQYAGAIGVGNVESGCVSETTGTVLATVRCSDRFDDQAPVGVFQGPGFDPHIWYQMVFGNTSANLLEAYRNSLPDKPDFDRLCASAEVIPPGANGLGIVAGDTSGNDSMFTGLTQQHTQGHRVRAILNAVAHALDAQVRTLCGDHMPESIRSAGGAARSRLWLQIKADVTQCRVQAMNCTEPTSLGAAILAASWLQGVSPFSLTGRWIKIRHECSPASLQQ